MKNKGTKKKETKKKNVQKSVSGESQKQVQTSWFYMNERFVELKEFYESVKTAGYDCEFWDTAGVLEIAVPDGKSMDVESMEPSFTDEEGMQFLQTHQIQTLFAVSFQADDEAKVFLLMKQQVETLGGFFCGDTADFMPVIGL